jgi:hypothetical protein
MVRRDLVRDAGPDPLSFGDLPRWIGHCAVLYRSGDPYETAIWVCPETDQLTHRIGQRAVMDYVERRQQAEIFEVVTREALLEYTQLMRRLTEALPVGVLHIGPDRKVNHRNDRLGVIVGLAARPCRSVLSLRRSPARRGRSRGHPEPP